LNRGAEQAVDRDFSDADFPYGITGISQASNTMLSCIDAEEWAEQHYGDVQDLGKIVLTFKSPEVPSLIELSRRLSLPVDIRRPSPCDQNQR
jgi:hypothetical protein